jgi:hypothetical protein
MEDGGLMTRKNARYSIIWALCVSPILWNPNCFAADPITWSPADAGLRLGLTTGPSRVSGYLRVALDNVGSSDLSALVAMRSGKGICYLFQFSAVAADGTVRPLWDFGPDSCPPSAGLLQPEIIRLAPRATREFVFRRGHLVYVDHGTEITLDSLLRQGYTLSAWLVVRQKDLDGAVMGGIPPPAAGRFWTGRLTSSLHLLKPFY